VKATSLVAAVLLAATRTGYAQEAPPQDARPPAVAALRVTFMLPAGFLPVAQDPAAAPDAQAPAAQAPPAARAAGSPGDRRDDIKTLEAVLTFAVKSGADKLALQMRASEPGSLFVIDTGRTRGFDLQGYGVFFDVDVPMMKQSVLWSTRQLTQQDTRAQLEDYVATQPQGPARDLAMRELRRLQQQGPQAGQRAVAAATPVTNSSEPGKIRAADVDVPAAPPAATREPADPNELYTEAVKTSLIDAMLKYSVGLKLGPDEWLTVAARDAQGPLTPGQPDDASTIVIRIKGSDIAAFHSNQLTREEVLKRVEVKEY
jgi:hypothetical protein